MSNIPAPPDNMEEAAEAGADEPLTLDFVPSYQAFPALSEQQLAYMLLLIRTPAQTALV